MTRKKQRKQLTISQWLETNDDIDSNKKRSPGKSDRTSVQVIAVAPAAAPRA